MPPIPARFPLLQRAETAALFQTARGVIRRGEFLAASWRLAAALAAEAPAGSPAGSVVLNLCEDRLSFALGFAAAMIAGCRSALSSDRSPARVRDLATRLGAAAILSETPLGEIPLGAPPLGETPTAIAPCRTVMVDPAALLAGATAAGGQERAANPEIAGETPAAEVFTSGSTGEPAAHGKTWGALFARSLAAASRFGLGADGPVSVVGTVPPQHMYGFETTILLAFHGPVTSWCGPAFFPHDIAAALAAMPAPRLLVTTPLQLRALLDAALSLPPLALVISATAPLAPDLAARAEARWRTRVAEIFGATEAGSIASRMTAASEIWEAYPGLRLAAAADGVVSVAAPFAETVALADALELVAPARFRLLGRRSDVVKLGGKRASLAALTRILTAIEGVEDGVFVAPGDLDAEPTARLLAFVVAPGREPGEILAALRREIDPIFLPRRVIPLPRLPRNEFGKLSAAHLAALAGPPARG